LRFKGGLLEQELLLLPLLLGAPRLFFGDALTMLFLKTLSFRTFLNSIILYGKLVLQKIVLKDDRL
jgi:hypothetical protein